MNDWLPIATESQLAQVATLATVILTRVAELSAGRMQSKAVIDLLETGDLAGARMTLGLALATVTELRGAVDTLEELAQNGV